MNKKIVLFDIDYTLFDTDKFRDITYPKLMSLLQQEDVPQYHQQVLDIEKALISKAGYEPVIFGIVLARALKIAPKHEQIEKIFYDNALYQQCLYPEVQNVLQKLSTMNDVVLGIVSKGEMTFQKRKIAPIYNFFSEKNVYISLNKFDMIHTILSNYENDELYVIDDSAPFLDSIKHAKASVFTIFVEKQNRYEKRETPAGFEPDLSIASLNEVLDIVDKSGRD